MATRRSTISTLMALPDVFGLDHVVGVLGCSHKAATVYCSRWRSSGLVSPLVERGVGVYFNTLRNSHAEDMLYEAVGLAVDGPLIQASRTALYAHGWLTRNDHVPQLAVRIERGRASLPAFEKVRILPRYPRRFDKLLAASDQVDATNTRLRLLSAEMAVADDLLSSARGLGTVGRASSTSSLIGDLPVAEVEDGIDAIDEALVILGATDEEREDFRDKLLRGDAPSP